MVPIIFKGEIIMAENNLWSQLNGIIEQTSKKVEVRDLKGVSKDEASELGFNPESLLGVIVSKTSGFTVDNWVRVLGQGISEYNKDKTEVTDGMLVVAFDVVGGLFALNVGRFEEAQSAVWYFAPDTLEWESLDVSYTGFIKWALTGDTDGFYSNMRWDSWEQDCKTIPFEEVMLIYPFLWANECNINTASKRVVAFNELYNLNLENWRKFNK